MENASKFPDCVILLAVSLIISDAEELEEEF
jgi:hypothetical protein